MTRRIFQIYVIYIAVVFCVSISKAGAYQVEVDDKRIFSVPYISGEDIAIDGMLEDKQWNAALVFNGFRRRLENLPLASDNTILRIFYDDKNLYMGFQCFDSDIKSLIAKAPADGCLNHADDRLEIFFDPLVSENAPIQYMIFNSKGILKTLGWRGNARDGWNPQIKRAVSVQNKFWTLEIKIPLKELGKNNLKSEICKLSVMRFQSPHSVSSLVPTKPKQSFSKEMVRLYFKPPGNNKKFNIITETRGDLALDGMLTGRNKVIFKIEKRTKQNGRLTLGVKSFVAGKTLLETKKEVKIDGSSEELSMYYDISGKENEEVTFSITDNETNDVLYSSSNRLSILNPLNRVYQIEKPLYDRLLDHRVANDSRIAGSATFCNYIGENFEAFKVAMKFGMDYSMDEIQTRLKESGIHSCHYADWKKDIRPVDSVCKKIWQSPGMIHWLVDGVQKENWAKPIVYTNYYVIGVDENGKKGLALDNWFGFTFDPINSNAHLKSVEHILGKYGNDLWAVFAGDEQFIGNYKKFLTLMKKEKKSIKASGEIDKINEEVKRDFGFGKFGIPLNMTQQNADYPFCRSAYIRWLQSKLRPVNKRLNKIVKGRYPQMPILSEDLQYDLNGDLTYFDEYADIGCFQLIKPFYTKKQNWTFRTKFVKDLSGLKHIWPVPHEAIDGYIEGSCHVNEMLELYSQLLRGGATGILAWPAAWNGSHPPIPSSQSIVIGDRLAWNFMLAMTKMINAMPPLKFPVADSGIFVSMNSLHCKDNRYPTYFNLERYDNTFTQLGVKSGAWFKFIASDRLLQGKEDLSKYKVIYIPDIKYSTPQVAEKLLDYCRNGGTVVALGPDPFEYNINSDSLTDIRRELFGIELNGKTAAKRMLLPSNKSLELKEIDLNNIRILDHDNVAVIARFDNNEAALTEKKIGKGKALYFTFMPINEATVDDQEWVDFWTDFHKKQGGSVKHDIWRFKLSMPELKGGVKPKVPDMYCLTGNFGFWNKCLFYGENSRFNLDLDGIYIIDQLSPCTFKKGTLTDRLSVAEYYKTLKNCNKKRLLKNIEPDKWVETFKSCKKNQVVFIFPRKCIVKNAALYFQGELDKVTMSLSQNGKKWQLAGSCNSKVTAKQYEVKHVEITSSSTELVNYVKLEFNRESSPDRTLTISEVELWGDCPELIGNSARQNCE